MWRVALRRPRVAMPCGCIGHIYRRGSGVPYGSVPADIESSRHSRKPREEDVLKNISGRSGSDQANEETPAYEAEGYDPWRVLGLKPGASTHMVRLRYHELMREVHPDLEPNRVGDISRLNQINKAYEIITKSPTIDRRYRNLVSDTQYFYYKFLPEWMARNVDEMPRYWSWVRWRTPGAFQVFLLCCGCYMVGRFYAAFPVLTTAFLLSLSFDILFHTMTAPATCSMLFLYAIMSSQSYDMAWLTSPKSFLKRELSY
ncbi:chaperone protein DNAj, putative [Trypanosoma equiperdum]|uniref:Chaperone protein DNAJ, putative n=2 Tax=Trypanozoon TaxID=39700 RepID=Q57Y63_TRYB2|nr:chaperone protein DNAJ, putative [Trypanosoma brucei brucei TREU927]AAX69456.1 chaperone protein DNAJ, putative [Trypanosoma brucei]AAZ12727.1 chaperone protein DNAJ, putative [Trypanosoma brucei brucei TREU927]SCU65641.1 chaperone protein DNAj, putative [Trypanosoma equiperdum]